MSQPLFVSTDPDLLDDLLRLAALAGVDAAVVPDVEATRRAWDGAPLIVVVDDLLEPLARARLARRPGVIVLGRDLDDASIWERAVDLGAERVAFLPDAESWLIEALTESVEGTGVDAPLVAVIGGRGGAGATTLACALAVTAARSGVRAALVDGDPLGGGIDLVFGAEQSGGVRWPDLVGARGRVPAAALANALPQMADLSVLSWDRGDLTKLPLEAVRSVLTATRRSHDLVVTDLPRSFDEASLEVLSVARTVLLVVPAEVRAAAAAGRVAAQVAALCRDVRLVVRGPSPAGLAAAEVQRALGLPLQGELRAEPGLGRDLEDGAVPGQRRGSPLASLSQAVLQDVLPGSVRRAA